MSFFLGARARPLKMRACQVMPRRVHVRAALSDGPHPQFVGLSEEKSCGSYAEKYGNNLYTIQVSKHDSCNAC
jgi:hypothetical protein